MLKKLSRYGNSLALILDKPILQLLDIDEDTVLKIQIDGQKITIVPAQEKPVKKKKSPKKAIVSKDRKTQEIFEDLIEEYSEALEKLAKN